jgi:RimJ/RimL family protein N-acetyltransferase
MPDPWPLRDLVLRTPRLTLRPDDDDGVYELAELALGGVHPAEEMPFAVPWTDKPSEDLVRETVQYHWATRAVFGAANWRIQFLVRHQGKVIGEQNLSAREFAITRTVSTGSWLGLASQRQGFGTEMRAAVLLLAFDHLGAVLARSGAFVDNPSSARVSEKLGYRTDGSNTWVRRGERATETRLVLEPEHFVRPRWVLDVAGVDGCRELLGARSA